MFNFKQVTNLFSVVVALSNILTVVSLCGCSGGTESPVVQLERARILMQREQPAEAVPILDEVIARTPESAEARYQRGVAMESLDALEKALLDYNECLKLSPDRHDALNNKAVVLAKLERFEEAEAVFTRLIEINPEQSLGYRNRALCKVDMKKLDAALADYAKALEIDPADPANWYQRAMVYQAQSRWNDADADFSKAIELDPELALAYMNRGVIRYRKGDKDASAKDLTKAQELDSDIVIPDVGFFSQHTDSATESVSAGTSAVWVEARDFAVRDLAARGAMDVALIQEFPEIKCGVFKVSMDGAPQSVVVTLSEDQTFELPAELLGNKSAADPALSENGAPQHLLVIRSKSDSSPEMSVSLFQRDWKNAKLVGQPSIMRFDLPDAGK